MTLVIINHTVVCGDSLCPERSFSFLVYVILYVAAAAVVFLTVCGNLLVIISVSHFKQLHTPANILILSLAVSDLLVGAFVMPLHFLWIIESCWTYGTVLCLMFIFFTFQATCVSAHTVALIAVERFFALNSPFFYSQKISPTVICIVTLFNWQYSVLYNFTLFYVNENFTKPMCPGVCSYDIDGFSSRFDLLTVFIMPCTLIITLYIRIIVIAKKHATAIRALQVHNSTESSKNRVSDKSEQKAAKQLGILIVVFFLCLLPYYVSSLVIQYDSANMFYARDVSVIFFFLNSTFNPIIYALFYPWFQKSLKLIFTFKVFHKGSSLIKVL